MIPDSDVLLSGIGVLIGPEARVTHEVLRAPHIPKSLPLGKCAVYVFSLSAAHGLTCEAGGGRVLKVGRVGPNSNARFQSQHYNPGSAMSSLARSLLEGEGLWSYLGIERLNDTDMGAWIRRNTDRDHFYLPASVTNLLPRVEKLVRGRLGGAVFEG
jgi:hypothetical protein